MSYYERRQGEVMEMAKEWQMEMQELPLSYYELDLMQDTLRCLGKRYGLLREFRENGLI